MNALHNLQVQGLVGDNFNWILYDYKEHKEIIHLFNNFNLLDVVMSYLLICQMQKKEILSIVKS